MVAVPARLPVITPPSDTATYFAFEVENFSVPLTSEGSICATSCRDSPRPMVVRAALRLTPMGAGDTVSAHAADTPL